MLTNADKARKNGNHKKAIVLYQNVIQEFPESADAHAGLSLSLFCLKKYDDAFLSALKATELDDKSALGHLGLAYSYHQRGQLNLYNDEVSKAFSYLPLVYEVACAYGLMLLNDKKVEQSLPIFQQMIEANQTLSCPHYFLGLAYSQKKNNRSALVEFKKSFQIHPSVTNSYWLIKTVIAIYPLILFIVLFVIIDLFLLVPPSFFIFMRLAFLAETIIFFNSGIQKVRSGQRKISLLYFANSIIGGWVAYILWFGK